MSRSLLERAIILVIDSLGIGAMPDADAYGDTGSHTLDNTVRETGIRLPNLTRLGIGCIEGVSSVPAVKAPLACYGRMEEASPGKDTTTGHWEIGGIVLDRAFATFPQGFPEEIMERFTEETGYGYLWAKPASGTEIIQRLGCEHLRTGKPIVYTSADSVFQIAAHEEVIPPDELYEICRKARRFLYDYNIGRVIARPFIGKPGGFRRTSRRKDFSVEPPGETLLDRLKKRGIPVVGIGKIGDIFVHRGLTVEIHTENNTRGMDRTIDAMRRYREGLIFTNLVDFDMLYGHRNNVSGYARALEEVDRRLPDLMGLVQERDIFILTADHGCDPTTPSTDHSREDVPRLVYGKGIKRGVDLGTRSTFADIAQTLGEVFGIEKFNTGRSFLKEII